MSRADTPSRLPALAALILALAASGCTKSIRADATRVAKAGAEAADGVEGYYGTLQADTVDQWEFFVFSQGYNFPPKSTPLTPEEAERLAQRTEAEKTLRDLYARQYDALDARRRLAGAMRKTYARFSDLADYNSAEAVNNALAPVLEPAKEVLSKPLPLPAGLVLAPITVIGDLVTEIETARQNRAIRRSSGQIVKIVQKYRDLFKAEQPIYKYIAEDRDLKSKTMLDQLLKAKALTAHDLLQRAVDGSGLNVSDAETIKDPKAIGGVQRVLEAKQNPIDRRAVSQEASDAMLDTLDSLVLLHQQLQKGQRPSFNEFLANSGTAKSLIDSIKAQLAAKAGK